MDKRIFILRDSSIRDRCKTYLDTLPLLPEDKPLKVTIEPYKKNRSLAQNSLLWLWLNQLSQYLRNECGIQSTPEDLKDHFQREAIGYRTATNPETEKIFVRVIGTSELNTAQFTGLLNEIERYAANVGLVLPHPEDLYYSAMGLKNDFR